MELKGSKTEANLWIAFAGESQARNKYDYFASKAKKEGYEQIAAIFEETAGNEKEHAKLWFKALGGIATTAENLLAAAAAVWGEVPVEAIRQVGSTFTGVEHRIEPVRTLDGVLYYNDSIGTSPTRTIAGLRSFDRKVILIAGGYDKHIPYEPLAPEIIAHVKNLVLMGATGPRIEQAVRECSGFDEAALPIQHADNMQHAVELARAAAKPGDIIILSPASASFDLYPNFEVRGREFKKIVNELK